jgi:hypothetical protein
MRLLFSAAWRSGSSMLTCKRGCGLQYRDENEATMEQQRALRYLLTEKKPPRMSKLLYHKNTSLTLAEVPIFSSSRNAISPAHGLLTFIQSIYINSHLSPLLLQRDLYVLSPDLSSHVRNLPFYLYKHSSAHLLSCADACFSLCLLLQYVATLH